MKLLSLLFFISAFSAHGEHLTTRVHSIDYAREPRHPHLILFENGRVGFMTSVEKAALLALDKSKKRNEWLKIELDPEGNILGAVVIPVPGKFPTAEDGPVSRPVSYEPSDLSTFEEAAAVFRRMNRNHQWSSQCYNRAHVWAYEEWKRSGLNSMKLFMFFTRSYIRRYRYDWWFHVTPMTYVNAVPLALDRTFTRGPLEMKAWTDNFIYSKRNCPVITKYSQYRENQETEHCYLFPVSMYFWQPRDLESNERTGYEKTQFVRSEVNWAYSEAF